MGITKQQQKKKDNLNDKTSMAQSNNQNDFFMNSEQEIILIQNNLPPLDISNLVLVMGNCNSSSPPLANIVLFALPLLEFPSRF